MLSNLDKDNVLYFFQEICKIPHGSGNEKGISDYIAKQGTDRNLYVRQDEFFNVVIKKPATKGCENIAPVILQGHIDMVCQKDNDIDIDFLKDPINIVVKDDFIMAKGTTLGADNGIAVAYMLALLDIENIKHPPLELVFTSEEETGLCGAIGLDVSDLESKRLINLDTEEEGYLIAGCSGGKRVMVSLPTEKATEIPKDYKVYEIKITGLQGGHSGADIGLQLANSNCLTGRLLNLLNEEFEYNLISVNGGTVDNAICKETVTLIATLDSNYNSLVKLINDFKEVVKIEYAFEEKNIQVILKESKLPEKFSILTNEVKENFINTMLLLPYGVQTMCTSLVNIVESSNNIGIIETKENVIEIHNAIRSSTKSRLDFLSEKVHCIAKVNGCTATDSNEYPGWAYDKDSKIISHFQKIYKDMNGKDPITTVIHAGLECGLFSEKIENLDTISIGPEMYDVHTTRERVCISSIFRVWEYLKEVLNKME